MLLSRVPIINSWLPITIRGSKMKVVIMRPKCMRGTHVAQKSSYILENGHLNIGTKIRISIAKA